MTNKEISTWVDAIQVLGTVAFWVAFSVAAAKIGVWYAGGCVR